MRRPEAGYSLVELVLVIVILATIGVLAGPRFFDNDAFEERGYYDELASGLRFAQKIAVASGCRVAVDISASSYALTQQAPQAGHCDPGDLSFPIAVRLSTGDVMAGSAPSGITTAPAITIIYDALGRTNLAVNQVVSVGTRTMTIEADSGLVVTP